MSITDNLPTIAGMTDAEAKTLALVFGDAAKSALDAVQARRPDAHNRVAPVQLSDGRWMLCADVLREALTGGLYAEGFALLPPELFSVVDVMPFADAVALLPQPELTERARGEEGRFIPDDPATPDVNEAWA